MSQAQPTTDTQPAQSNPRATRFDFIRTLTNASEYLSDVLLVMLGLFVLTDFVLDLAVIITFAINRDVVWFTMGLTVTIISTFWATRLGWHIDLLPEQRWHSDAKKNSAISVAFSLSHSRVLANAIRIAKRRYDDENPNDLINRLRDPLYTRGLSGSFLMLALKTYVLENNSSALLYTSSAFSVVSLAIGVDMYFCHRGSGKERIWTILHVLCQLVYRIISISLLATSVKSYSFIITIPMLLIAFIFCILSFQNSGSQLLTAFGRGLFTTPVVVLIAVRPTVDDIEGPFMGEWVHKFMLWRVLENAAVTLWLTILISIGSPVLISLGALLTLFILSLILAVVTLVMVERTVHSQHVLLRSPI